MDLGHLGAVFGGLMCVAIGAGWLPNRWQMGRATRTIMVIGGAAGIVSGVGLYVASVQARSNSWYVLDIDPPSCRELFAQTGLTTPDDLATRASCRFDETTVPGATRMYCPNERVYLYLYPERQLCESALETLQANMDAFRAPTPTPPEQPN